MQAVLVALDHGHLVDTVVHADAPLGERRPRGAGDRQAQLEHVDGLHLELLTLGAREREQVLDEQAHALGLLVDLAEHHVHVADRAAAVELGVAAHAGQRGAQLVGGVADEAAHLLLLGLRLADRGLQALQHRVQRSGQLADLGVGVPLRQAPVVVAGGDGVGGLLDLTERAQGARGHHVAQPAHHGERDEADQALDVVQVGHDRVLGGQRLRHDRRHALLTVGDGAPAHLVAGVGVAADGLDAHAEAHLPQVGPAAGLVVGDHRAVLEDLDHHVLAGRARPGAAGVEDLGVVGPAAERVVQLLVDAPVDGVAHDLRDRDRRAEQPRPRDQDDQRQDQETQRDARAQRGDRPAPRAPPPVPRPLPLLADAPSAPPVAPPCGVRFPGAWGAGGVGGVSGASAGRGRPGGRARGALPAGGTRGAGLRAVRRVRGAGLRAVRGAGPACRGGRGGPGAGCAGAFGHAGTRVGAGRRRCGARGVCAGVGNLALGAVVTVHTWARSVPTLDSPAWCAGAGPPSRRRRAGCGSGARAAQHVADAAHGVDQRLIARVDLAAQVGDVGLDDVAVAAEVVVPDVVEDL